MNLMKHRLSQVPRRVMTVVALSENVINYLTHQNNNGVPEDENSSYCIYYVYLQLYNDIALSKNINSYPQNAQ